MGNPQNRRNLAMVAHKKAKRVRMMPTNANIAHRIYIVAPKPPATEFEVKLAVDISYLMGDTHRGTSDEPQNNLPKLN